MKLVVILGNAAVGKMTVGQELMKLTGLRLFHNHMSIELSIDVFGTYHRGAVGRIRDVIFEEFAASDQYGMIFTYMMDFDMPSEWEYLQHLEGIFKDAEVYYVELVAPQEIRLQRNVTENRLQNKASKRDIEISNQRLIDDDIKHRCVSRDGEVKFKNYIKIDNSQLSPQEAAKLIQERFSL